MHRGLRPTPALLVLLALGACDNATEPRLDTPRPLFDHDPATQVTTLANDGPGSLREVVFNASSGALIHFAAALAGGTIVVNSPILLDHSVAIVGPASGGIIISGGGATTVFSVQNGILPTNVTMQNLTIIGADDEAIMLSSGTLNVMATTLTANLADGITNVGGDLFVENSTISGNGGRGITSSGGTATVLHATITGNSRGIDRSSPLTLRNALIADNATDCDFAPGAPPVVLIGANLDSDETCGLTNFDYPGLDPLLGPLANNGGPTATHALAFGSPAIDATSCPLSTDVTPRCLHEVTTQIMSAKPYVASCGAVAAQALSEWVG